MSYDRKLTPIPTPTAADIADAVMVARQNAERANDVRLRCAWTALEALILGGPDMPCEGIIATATLGDIAYRVEFGYIRIMEQIDADAALEAVWGAGLVRDDAGRQHWLKIAEAHEARRSEAEHKNDFAAMVAAVLAARPPEGTDRGKDHETHL